MIINLIEYLEETVKKDPYKIAVIEGERRTDILTLTKQAKQLSGAISSLAGGINNPVAVFLHKSTECVIADLAITYSGNIYMNLDVKNPESRILNILEKIEPVVIITNGFYIEKLRSFCPAGIKILNIGEAGTEAEVHNPLPQLRELIDTDPYCIINTSGSTGTPKGVVLNHKSFVDFIEWSVETLSIPEHELIGSLSPIYFDIFSFELCLLMARSATIVIIPEQLATFPAKLAGLLADEKISFIFWVPTIMVNMANLDILSSFELPAMKRIWFAGEVFPTKHLNYWRRKIPGAVFTNLYGPIEITLDCTYYTVEKEFPDDMPVPIGYPCRNTDVLILNEENMPAGVNEKGELCVRGTSLALGYYNDPEKTAGAFVQNPLNKSYPELIYRTGDVVYKNEEGVIFFTGRKDFQVKHLGYRIDLSELEHVILNKWGKVKNGCVIYNNNKKEISLLYEGREEISPAVFRKELAAYFPKYMVPTQFRLFEELPRNPNGKIDRNALNKLVQESAG